MKLVQIKGLTYGIFGELRNIPSQYQLVINENEFVIDRYGRWFRDSLHRRSSGSSESIAVLSAITDDTIEVIRRQGRSLRSDLEEQQRNQIGRVCISKISVEQNFKGGCIISGTLHNCGSAPWLGWGVVPDTVDALGIRVLNNESLVSEQRYQLPFEIVPPRKDRDFVWILTSRDSQLAPGPYTIELDMVREHVGWFSEPESRLRIECLLHESGPLDTSSIRCGDQSVALTFDGGSRDTGTAELLDVLAAHQIQCTMFLTGQFISRRPELVQRMVQEGHELANHSMTHPRFVYDFEDFPIPGITRDFLRSQILDVEAVGRFPLQKLWRAPYGHSNGLIRSWALAEGYRHIYWSYDSRDWTVGTTPQALSAAEVCNRTLAYLYNLESIEGEILLYHLMQNPNDPISGHLDRMIRDLKTHGVVFKTVGAMINSERVSASLNVS